MPSQARRPDSRLSTWRTCSPRAASPSARALRDGGEGAGIPVKTTRLMFSECPLCPRCRLTHEAESFVPGYLTVPFYREGTEALCS